MGEGQKRARVVDVAAAECGPVYIYGLWCPIAEAFRYVGQTRDLSGRYANHVSANASAQVREWIDALRYFGKAPRLDVLASLDGNADAMERHFIEMHRKTILNVHLGGTRSTRGPRRGPRSFVSVGATVLRAWVGVPGAVNALSRKIGAPYGLVSRWSRGRTQPTARWCAAIEAECGIPIGDWVVPALAEVAA